MDMQNVSNLVIPEGEVRTIHDENGNLLWGKVNYNVKYAGDTFQQYYSGKNFCSSVRVFSNNALRLNFGDQSQIPQTFTLSFICPTLPTSPKTASVLVYYNGSANTGKVAEINAVSGQRVSATVSLSSDQWASLQSGSGGFIQMYSSGAWTGTTADGYGEPQIEAGTYVTSYEPFVGGQPSPSPSFPQNVEVVSGQQTVTVSDGDSQSQSYAVNLGSLELCKINNCRDYIYKSGGDWYVHKAIGKISSYNGEAITTDYISTTGILTNGATVYYCFAAATDTKITDTPLISQLNSIHQFLTRYGYNATVSGDLPLIIDKTNL